MGLLHEIMHHNKNFVASGKYRPYETSRYPAKKLVVLSCMDTRLTDLLPRAMNLKNGDAKVIKNAGAIITHPFGSVMKSILVAIYELEAKEICVVGHRGCGMETIQPAKILSKMKARGIDDQVVHILSATGIHLESWLKGFDSVADNVTNSVGIIRNHPLLPKDVHVHGLIIDPRTGKLELIDNGYLA